MVSPVHPRVCGAHRLGSADGRRGGGPSPRLRGSRRHPSPGARSARSIPASAGLTWGARTGSSRPAVHPRVCGAHPATLETGKAQTGPSPRLRGSRRGLGGLLGGRRSIPASAGLTRPAAAGGGSSSVHPRVCGAHGGSRGCGGCPDGPSPRLRGSREPGLVLQGHVRSIPASAGLTSSMASSDPSAAVHPRVCGAHLRWRDEENARIGPSPRLRGSRTWSRWCPCRGRSIPASAGLTSSRASRPRPRAVHPRVCGAHLSASSSAFGRDGPSPRLRGSRDAGQSHELVLRSIPASAGLTTLDHLCRDLRTVHPRVCGAHRVVVAVADVVAGPSPRLRGSQQVLADDLELGRSIPASAGLTGRRSWGWSRRSVHPRVCGAHTRCTRIEFGPGGPSPRLRGSPAAPVRGDRHRRSIPASAGLTSARSG